MRARLAWLYRIVLIMLVYIAYRPALQGPFFFDDEHFIQRNEFVLNWAQDLGATKAIYSSSVTEGAHIAGSFYRPHQQMAFAMLNKLFGLDPVKFHLFSLLCHALAGLLLFLWLRQWGLNQGPALLGAGFFLLHPVQTEAVCYISGLADPLATCCILGALVVLSRPGPRWREVFVVAGAWILFVNGLLAKESAVVLAPILGVTLIGMKGTFSGLKKYIWIVAFFGLTAGCYTILRMTVLNFNGALSISIPHNDYTDSLSLRLMTFVNVLWDYIVLILWPKDLFYEKPYVAYSQIEGWRGAMGLTMVGVVVLSASQVSRAPRAVAAVLIFVAAMIPYMGFLPINAIFLEHWLYMPMIGVSLGVATLVQRVMTGQRQRWQQGVGAVVILGVTSLMVYRTHIRAGEWGDVEKFYLNEINHGAGSMRMLNNLGMYYADKNRLDLALEYYQKSIDLPKALPLPQPHHNKAQIYLKQGMLPEAIGELRKGLIKDPQFIYSLRLLENIFRALGDQERTKVVIRTIELVSTGKSYDFQEFDRQVFGEH